MFGNTLHGRFSLIEIIPYTYVKVLQNFLKKKETIRELWKSAKMKIHYFTTTSWHCCTETIAKHLPQRPQKLSLLFWISLPNKLKFVSSVSTWNQSNVLTNWKQKNCLQDWRQNIYQMDLCSISLAGTFD